MQHMGGIYKFLTDGNKDLSSAIGVAWLGLWHHIALSFRRFDLEQRKFRFRSQSKYVMCTWVPNVNLQLFKEFLAMQIVKSVSWLIGFPVVKFLLLVTRILISRADQQKMNLRMPIRNITCTNGRVHCQLDQGNSINKINPFQCGHHFATSERGRRKN